MAAELIYNSETKALFGQAVQIMFTALLPSTKRRIVIALPGGRSIVGLLQALAERTDGMPEDLWSRLHFFSVDERLVPDEHADNNFKLLREVFFDQALKSGLIAESQLHRFSVGERSVQAEIGRYQKELEECGGRFDVSFLGVGEDGHIAALFPRHKHLGDPSPGFLALNDSPKPPPGRMTASPRLIASSTLVFALFIGHAKREALRLYSDSQVPVEACPVKLIDLVEESYVLTDQDLGVNMDYFAKRL